MRVTSLRFYLIKLVCKLGMTAIYLFPLLNLVPSKPISTAPQNLLHALDKALYYLHDISLVQISCLIL